MKITATTNFDQVARHLRSLPPKIKGRVVARSLNHVGGTTRTNIKRIIVQASGLKSGVVGAGMSVKRATAFNPEYVIRVRGKYHNAGAFGAREIRSGVSAAPWKRRQRFKSAFMINGAVLVRTGSGRYPIKAVFGPSPARELMRPENGAQILITAHLSGKVMPRVRHELLRVLKM